MDGRINQSRSTERPIAKPDFPLPMIFSPSKRSEMPTQRQTSLTPKRERAHFYKKLDEKGRPTYEFCITSEPTDRDTSN